MFLEAVPKVFLPRSRQIVWRPLYGHVSPVRFYHVPKEAYDEPWEPLPDEWFNKAFGKMVRLSGSLNGVDFVNGRVVNARDGSIIGDDSIEHKMHAFRSLVRVFVGSPSVQQSMKSSVAAFLGDGSAFSRHAWFDEVADRQPMVVNSLTKIGDILKVSAQQRKTVRLAISSQVTQHRIWTGVLDWILSDLKCELDRLNGSRPSHVSKMGLQIVCSCLDFLNETTDSYDEESASWMRLLPTNNSSSSKLPHTWADLLEMINDLTRCLRGTTEESITFHTNKLNVMNEGLFQIKDVQVNKNAGYKDLRHQKSLVRKNLKTLGHASPCLFDLLCYYLYGSLQDIRVDLRGGFLKQDDGSTFCLYMGQILSCKEEDAVWSGVKQLNKVLGLFGFIWETAGMNGALELHGHLWCVGSDSKVLTYKGNTFFLHGISL